MNSGGGSKSGGIECKYIVLLSFSSDQPNDALQLGQHSAASYDWSQNQLKKRPDKQLTNQPTQTRRYRRDQKFRSQGGKFANRNPGNLFVLLVLQHNMWLALSTVALFEKWFLTTTIKSGSWVVLWWYMGGTRRHWVKQCENHNPGIVPCVCSINQRCRKVTVEGGAVLPPPHLAHCQPPNPSPPPSSQQLSLPLPQGGFLCFKIGALH